MGHGCPRCAQERGSTSRRRPPDFYDDHIAAVGAEWTEPYTTSGALRGARCLKCRHRWKVTPNTIQQGKGCPNCAGQYVGESTWNERIAARGAKWLEPVTRADGLYLAECLERGHRWKARPSHIRDGVGCPECVEHGFKALEPALLYLMVKDDGVAKVGISGEGKAMRWRITAHKRTGYRLVKEWQFDEGQNALIVEREVIRQWRQDDDLLPAAPKGEDGYTETIHTEDVPLAEIIRRIETMIEDLRSLY
jgi:hypothetical protein